MKIPFKILAFCLISLFSFTHIFAQEPQFDWVQQVDGGFDFGQFVASDNYGNVYISGYYRRDDKQGYFVQKYTGNGEALWRKEFETGENPTESTRSHVVVDESGNVYVAANFMGTVDFDPSEKEHITTSLGYPDAFIQKLERLKYTYRPDIRDREALEKNFREKFQKLWESEPENSHHHGI